jgi:periplasmic mercuric ion binding protein
MAMKRSFVPLAALLVLAAPAWAASNTVTLFVPTMDCPVCPITVKKALTKVPGVTRTEVDFDRREATVTFDDGRASVEALTKATGDAGYPSTLAGGAK